PENRLVLALPHDPVFHLPEVPAAHHLWQLQHRHGLALVIELVQDAICGVTAEAPAGSLGDCDEDAVRIAVAPDVEGHGHGSADDRAVELLVERRPGRLSLGLVLSEPLLPEAADVVLPDARADEAALEL